MVGHIIKIFYLKNIKNLAYLLCAIILYALQAPFTYCSDEIFASSSEMPKGVTPLPAPHVVISEPTPVDQSETDVVPTLVDISTIPKEITTLLAFNKICCMEKFMYPTETRKELIEAYHHLLYPSEMPLKEATSLAKISTVRSLLPQSLKGTTKEDVISNYLLSIIARLNHKLIVFFKSYDEERQDIIVEILKIIDDEQHSLIDLHDIETKIFETIKPQIKGVKSKGKIAPLTIEQIRYLLPITIYGLEKHLEIAAKYQAMIAQYIVDKLKNIYKNPDKKPITLSLIHGKIHKLQELTKPAIFIFMNILMTAIIRNQITRKPVTLDASQSLTLDSLLQHLLSEDNLHKIMLGKTWDKILSEGEIKGFKSYLQQIKTQSKDSPASDLSQSSAESELPSQPSQALTAIPTSQPPQPQSSSQSSQESKQETLSPTKRTRALSQAPTKQPPQRGRLRSLRTFGTQTLKAQEIIQGAMQVIYSPPQDDVLAPILLQLLSYVQEHQIMEALKIDIDKETFIRFRFKAKPEQLLHQESPLSGVSNGLSSPVPRHKRDSTRSRKFSRSRTSDITIMQIIEASQLPLIPITDQPIFFGARIDSEPTMLAGHKSSIFQVASLRNLSMTASLGTLPLSSPTVGSSLFTKLGSLQRPVSPGLPVSGRRSPSITVTAAKDALDGDQSSQLEFPKLQSVLTKALSPTTEGFLLSSVASYDALSQDESEGLESSSRSPIRPISAEPAAGSKGGILRRISKTGARVLQQAVVRPSSRLRQFGQSSTDIFKSGRFSRKSQKPSEKTTDAPSSKRPSVDQISKRSRRTALVSAVRSGIQRMATPLRRRQRASIHKDTLPRSRSTGVSSGSSSDHATPSDVDRDRQRSFTPIRAAAHRARRLAALRNPNLATASNPANVAERPIISGNLASTANIINNIGGQESVSTPSVITPINTPAINSVPLIISGINNFLNTAASQNYNALDIIGNSSTLVGSATGNTPFNLISNQNNGEALVQPTAMGRKESESAINKFAFETVAKQSSASGGAALANSAPEKENTPDPSNASLSFTVHIGSDDSKNDKMDCFVPKSPVKIMDDLGEMHENLKSIKAYLTTRKSVGYGDEMPNLL